MTGPKLPRIGDRADLQIDIAPLAVTQYQTFLADRRGEHQRILSDEDARAELLTLVRASYVVSSIGESMQTRCRSGPLGVDLQAEITRKSPTHLRVVAVGVRIYDRAGRRGSNDAGAEKRTVSGLGTIRVMDDGSMEWRERGAVNVWAPFTRGHVARLAREKADDERLWAWLRERGVERPRASGPSGPTQAEEDRETERVTLRLLPTDAERLRDLARARGRTIAAVVTEWIRRGE